MARKIKKAEVPVPEPQEEVLGQEAPVEAPKVAQTYQGANIVNAEDVEINGTPVKKLTLDNGTTTIVPLDEYNNLI